MINSKEDLAEGLLLLEFNVLFLEEDIRSRAKQELKKHPEGVTALSLLKSSAIPTIPIARFLTSEKADEFHETLKENITESDRIDYVERLENMRLRKAPDTPKQEWYDNLEQKAAEIIVGFKQATPYSALHSAAKETNTSPTETQIKAENYKKGKFKLDGLTIAIENPANTYREGKSDDGKKWKSKMYHNYGYVLGTHGADGDHVDVFIKHNSKSSKEINTDKVFVINQVHKGKFDEHKCMIGFSSEEEARKGYLSCYEKGWDGLGSIKEKSWDEFKAWVKDKASTKKVASFKHKVRNFAHKFNPKGIEKAEARGLELFKAQQDAIKDVYKKTTTPNSRPTKQMLVDLKDNRIKANKYNQNAQIAAGLSVPVLGVSAAGYGLNSLNNKEDKVASFDPYWNVDGLPEATVQGATIGAVVPEWFTRDSKHRIGQPIKITKKPFLPKRLRGAGMGAMVSGSFQQLSHGLGKLMNPPAEKTAFFITGKSRQELANKLLNNPDLANNKFDKEILINELKNKDKHYQDIWFEKNPNYKSMLKLSSEEEDLGYLKGYLSMMPAGLASGAISAVANPVIAKNALGDFDSESIDKKDFDKYIKDMGINKNEVKYEKNIPGNPQQFSYVNKDWKSSKPFGIKDNIVTGHKNKNQEFFIKHEAGHHLNSKNKFLRGMQSIRTNPKLNGRFGNVVQEIVPSALALSGAANNNDAMYDSAAAFTALKSAPTMIDETMANTRATKNMMKTHGFGKGLRKSLFPAALSMGSYGLSSLGIPLTSIYGTKFIADKWRDSLNNKEASSKKKEVEITVTMPEGEGADCVVNVLDQIKTLGNWGSSREIAVIDDNYNGRFDRYFKKKNYFDGDGADKIISIKVDGKEVKLEKQKSI